MPPPVVFQPPRSCGNFPLCRSNAVMHREGSRQQAGSRRVRAKWCKNCSARQLCRHPGCSQHAAPDSKKFQSTGLCADHYGDPAYAWSRCWSLCRNSRFGCQHLALSPTGGKCHACQNNSLPCLHAPLGCLNHVRYDTNTATRKRKVCHTHSGLCIFDPSRKKARCVTPFCANPAQHNGFPLCPDCRIGHIPCFNV